MGLFSRKPQIDPQEMVALRHEFADLRNRLDASERARIELEAQLQELDAATAGLAARSHMVDEVTLRLAEVEVLKRQVAQIDVVNAKIHSLDSLNGKFAELSDRVTASADDARQARDQATASHDDAKAARELTAALHERVSNVSTELANQLSELSGEIDGIARTQASAAAAVASEQPISNEVLEKLTGAQVRLANEQARYEIAFRQDLATLAEQVKRSRTDR